MAFRLEHGTLDKVKCDCVLLANGLKLELVTVCFMVDGL